MSKKSTPQRRPWKKHKQVLVDIGCGSKVEIDKKMVRLVRFMNIHNVTTRHSCQGRKGMRAYVSMISQPHVKGLAHYLIENGAPLDLTIEVDIHPLGYENLVFRWPVKHHEAFYRLVVSYYTTPR